VSVLFSYFSPFDEETRGKNGPCKPVPRHQLSDRSYRYPLRVLSSLHSALLARRGDRLDEVGEGEKEKLEEGETS
jgi:hypothetical protein